MSVKVKICGITNLDDALAAVDAGADALGFVFCDSSPRRVAPGIADAVISRLPPFVTAVGLFVNAPEAAVREILNQCRIQTLQFHGAESPNYCQSFKQCVIKAFRVQDETSLAALVDYSVAGWLLDSYVPGQAGGTGARFNWDLAVRAKAWCPRLILAGGLTPANVAEAVRQVRPYAVDVSSGVESAPGRKDRAKLNAFIRAAKTALEAE